MELKYIKTKKCPVCGCSEIVEEKVEYDEYGIRKHCNGTTWEHRKFLCGQEIAFCPNFGREIIGKTCKKDPALLAKKQKEKEDAEKLADFCAKNDIEITRYVDDYIRKISKDSGVNFYN